MNPQLAWKAGAVFAATGITANAFGSHALKARVPPASVQSWQTASTYLIYSGLSLLAISLHPRHGRNKWAVGLIGGGAIVFSGSIFGLVLAREKTGKFLGPITPIGGMGMIIGFLALAF